MSSAVTKLTAVVGGGHSVMTGLAESLTWNCQQPWWQGFPMSPPLLPRPRPLHPIFKFLYGTQRLYHLSVQLFFANHVSQTF